MEDSLMVALLDTYAGLYMAQTAEKLARQYNLSREEQDQFALRSQTCAGEAVKAGRLQEEIVRHSKRILRGRVADAAATVVTLMDRGTAEDKTRLSAAQDVLDRIHGKAPARIVGADEDLPPLLVQFVHPAAPKEKPVG